MRVQLKAYTQGLLESNSSSEVKSKAFKGFAKCTNLSQQSCMETVLSCHSNSQNSHGS